MPIEKSAGAVVFYKSGKPRTTKHFLRKVLGVRGKKIEYLLLHHELGHWDFPKGWIERREKLEETAKREIGEETGIKDIEFIPGFKEHIKYFFKWEGKNIFKIVTFFLAETKAQDVVLSFEHIGYKWLPYEEALKQLTHKDVKEVLKKAHQFIKNKELVQRL